MSVLLCDVIINPGCIMTLNIKKYDQFLPLTLRLKKFAVKQDLVNSNVLNLNMGI